MSGISSRELLRALARLGGIDERDRDSGGNEWYGDRRALHEEECLTVMVSTRTTLSLPLSLYRYPSQVIVVINHGH